MARKEATRKVLAEEGCVSHFSIAAIKCHDQGNLQKEEFIWT